MTRNDRKQISNVLRATEYLFLENLALKLVLEHRAVPNWQPLLEKLLADKEIMAGVHLKFKDLYEEMDSSKNPSQALDAFLAGLPKPKKPQ